MRSKTFPPKHEDETLTYGFDFAAELPAGVSIVTANPWTATTVSGTGTDPSPGAIISGAAQISGSISLQQITGGVPGVLYCIEGEVVTDSVPAETLVGKGYLYIKPPC